MRLLIAEDDRALGMLLRRGLETEGHKVTLADDGEMAVSLFLQEMPDMTILDLNLPKKDGTEVLRFLRNLDADVPILILTARNEPDTKLRCFDLGADDCMLKPFSLQELRARCRVLLKRTKEKALLLRYADLELNRVERTVSRSGQPVILTNKEYALLEYLLLHRGSCVARSTLLNEVWEMSPTAGTNVVDVYVNYLRRKLLDYGPVPLIQTIRGKGYSIGMQAHV